MSDIPIENRPIEIYKEMGITHAEFRRLLPRALGHPDAPMEGTNFSCILPGGGALKIELGPESERQIALMRIATTPVTLTFEGLSDADVAAFVARFDRVYQRGGG